MARAKDPKISEKKHWSEQKRQRGQKNAEHVTSQHAKDVQELEGHREKHFKHHRAADPFAHKMKKHTAEKK